MNPTIDQGPDHLAIEPVFRLDRHPDGALSVRGMPDWNLNRPWGHVYDELVATLIDNEPNAHSDTLSATVHQRLSDAKLSRKRVQTLIKRTIKRLTQPSAIELARTLLGEPVTVTAYNLCVADGNTLEYLDQLDYGKLVKRYLATNLGVTPQGLRPQTIIEYFRTGLTRPEWTALTQLPNEFFERPRPSSLFQSHMGVPTENHHMYTVSEIQEAAKLSVLAGTALDTNAYLRILDVSRSARGRLNCEERVAALKRSIARLWGETAPEDRAAAIARVHHDKYVTIDYLAVHPMIDAATIDRRHYNTLYNAGRAWHARNNRNGWYRYRSDPSAVWDSAISETLHIDDHQAVPLTTGLMLIEEGQIMSHCVATYANACQTGGSRIFSIRTSDKHETHVATLELVPFNKRWHVNQLLGPRNRSVTRRIQAVGQRVATLYNAATAPQTADH